MSEVKLVKVRFKEGKKQIWLDWCEELKKRSAEVLETLKNEGVILEACFLSEDEQCVYYFMEADDFKKATAAVKKNTFPIDKEHRKKREMSLELVAELECLFFFENKQK